MPNPRAGETHTDGGSFTVANTGGTITGSIEVGGTLVIGVGAGATNARPNVTITNDGVIPDGMIVAELPLSTPAVSVTSLIGAAVSDSIENDVTLYPKSDNSTTLTLHFNGATSASMVFTAGG